jgi:hypothetical protein
VTATLDDVTKKTKAPSRPEVRGRIDRLVKFGYTAQVKIGTLAQLPSLTPSQPPAAARPAIRTRPQPRASSGPKESASACRADAAGG